jgi:hypothetical protein
MSPIALALVASGVAACTAVSAPARGSIIPDVFARRDLFKVNRSCARAATTALILAPVASSGTIDWRGFEFAYAVEVTLGLAAVAMFWFATRHVGSSAPRASTDSPSPRERAGPTRRLVVAAVGLDGFCTLTCAARTTYPAIGVNFGFSKASTFLLFSTFAAGALIGTLIRRPIDRRGVSQGRIFLDFLGVKGASVTLLGIVVALLPEGFSLATAVLLLLVVAMAGLGDAASSVAIQNIIHQKIPKHSLGSMQGAFFVLTVAALRLGDGGMASLASWQGEGAALVLGGMACLFGVAALGARLRILAQPL